MTIKPLTRPHLVAAACVLLAVSPAGFGQLSQVSPGEISKQQQDTREYYELLQKEREQEGQQLDVPVIEKEPLEEPDVPAPSGRTIVVNRFDVSPSAILTEAEISSVTSGYLSRELGIEQLQVVVEQLNELYATKPGVVARAVLPKQTVRDGVIRIDLIEARLGTLRVEGNDKTRDSYIERRIKTDTGELIQLNELEADLLRFNRLNDVFLRATLVPGEEYGTTDVVLLAREAQPYTVNTFVDNAGRETVGEARLGLTFQAASLFGFRDRLFLGGTYSEGSLYGWGTYDFPVHRSGTRVELRYDRGDIDIVDGPLEPLNITGDSTDAGVTILQPISIRSTMEWDGSFGYISKEANSYFDGIKLVETTADDFVLATNLRFFDPKGTWLTSHALTYGDSDAVIGQNYFIYNGSVIRLQNFDNGSNLIFRASAQLSDTDFLPSFEQFIIGGMATVRGYSEGILAGDQGYLLSAEWAYPMRANFFQRFTERSNVFVFFDNGAAFPYRGGSSSSNSDDFLASVGFGFDFDFLKRLSLKASLGVPLLDDREPDQDSFKFHLVFAWNVW